jgi:hypothetical protein
MFKTFEPQIAVAYTGSRRVARGFAPLSMPFATTGYGRFRDEEPKQGLPVAAILNGWHPCVPAVGIPLRMRLARGIEAGFALIGEWRQRAKH